MRAAIIVKFRDFLPTRQELLVSTGLWIALGFWLGLERATAAHAAHSAVPTWSIYRDAIFEHIILAVIAPLALVAARLFPFTKAKFWKSLGIHAIVCGAYSALHVELGRLFDLPMPAVRGHSFTYGFTLELYSDVWMYALMVATWSMLSLSKRYREEERRASQLQVRLAEAELLALRAQMQPHFLFNTLNSISSLMHQDVAAADDMLADLSFMLRRSLEQSSQPVVPLEEEVELVKTYVRIQQRRFQDRLQTNFVIPHELRRAGVPALLLQTFVENSIRHGIAPYAQGGNIQVVASREGDKMRIEVLDDGGGFPETMREGVGLTNSRERLRQMYGGAAALQLAPRFPRGAAVSITLPLEPLNRTKEGHDAQDADRGRRTVSTGARPVATR